MDRPSLVPQGPELPAPRDTGREGWGASPSLGTGRADRQGPVYLVLGLLWAQPLELALEELVISVQWVQNLFRLLHLLRGCLQGLGQLDVRQHLKWWVSGSPPTPGLFPMIGAIATPHASLLNPSPTCWPSPPLSSSLPVSAHLPGPSLWPSVPHLPHPGCLSSAPLPAHPPALTSSMSFLACRSSGELMGGGRLRPKLWGMTV